MSRPSIWLVGLDVADERDVVPDVGDPSGFFARAQRLAWGVTQADLLPIDVRAAVQDLLAHHDSSFVAHLMAAWALRALDEPEALRFLDRARERVPEGHRLAHLLPTQAEWACEAPPQRLEPFHPGRVWRAATPLTMSGSPFLSRSVATFVRLEDGSLLVINPVPLEPDVAREVSEIGPVRFVAVQSKGHSRYVDAARTWFPEARVLCTAGHRTHPGSAHVRFDAALDEEHGLPEECQLFPVTGTELAEVVVLHRPTGTLVLQDLLLGAVDTDGPMWLPRLYALSFGVLDRVGWAAYQLILWRNMRAFAAGLRAIDASGFTSVVSAHWTAASRQEETVAEVHTALRWACDVGTSGHLGMLARLMVARPDIPWHVGRYTWKRMMTKPAPSAERAGER